MTRILTQPMRNTNNPVELTRFFEEMRDTNPFSSNRVVQPSSDMPDVAAVHQAQFDHLTQLANQACRQDLSIGAVLWGEPGAGKSHLLSRLSRWADQNACFVFLQNLQASPVSLPRTLLRATLSILTEGRQGNWHESKLYRFVNAALKAAFQQAGLDTTAPVQPDQAYRAYHKWLDRICQQNPYRAPLIQRETIYNVLFKFYESAHFAKKGKGNDYLARLAVQWLSGDYLDADQARELGLPRLPVGEEGIALESDEDIKRVLVALCQFADLRRQPFILCFDSVDGLDAEQANALTRFLHALLDSAINLLVITSGVQETLERWHTERVIPQASWNRIAQEPIAPLTRISEEQARKIVEVRLQQFLDSFDTLEPVKKLRFEDQFFPLGKHWFEEFLKGKPEVRARDVIDWARTGWVGQQQRLRKEGGQVWLERWPGKQPPPPPGKTLEETIDDAVAARLDEHVRDRQHHPERLPPDADNLAGLLANLLKQCQAKPDQYDLAKIEQARSVQRIQTPTFQMKLHQKLGTTGILVLTTSNATSAAAFLRRVMQEPKPPTRFVLVTDERRPVRLGAAGKRYGDSLQQRYGPNYLEHQLSFDQYAQLDALQVVIGMARSGDLEVEHPHGKLYQVSEVDVLESHHRQGRYREKPLLGHLLGECHQQTKSVANGGIKRSEQTGSFNSEQITAGIELTELEWRQVIKARLALMPGASSHELTNYAVGILLLEKKLRVDAAHCKNQLESVAHRMAAEGLVNVAPLDDGIFVTARKR